MIIIAGSLLVAEEFVNLRPKKKLINLFRENYYSPFLIPAFFKKVFQRGSTSADNFNVSVPAANKIIKQILLVNIPTKP